MEFLTSDLLRPTFSEMDLSPEIQSALERLQIQTPTTIQQQTIPVSLQGSDLIAIGQTGSGKTLIYLLTIFVKLQKDPAARALILTPSRETAQQVFQVVTELFKDWPVKTCLVVAGLPEKTQVSQLNKLPQIIVATPGRMLDHLEHNRLLLQKVSQVIIDEADRMLDQGFGPQLKKIKATMRGEFQTIMMGASFGPSAQKFATGFFRPKCYLIRASGAERPVSTLKQIVFYTEAGAKNDKVFEALKDQKGQTIVFVKNQPNSESVYSHLAANGLSTDVIHGGFENGHRERVIKDFRSGKFQILVTTDLLARGLDVPNITLVVNFDLPNETEDFLHRIGRTARAGQSGTAITFVSRSEREEFLKFKAYTVDAEERH